MKWRTKIKAGSLQFVLFIGAVIAVLLLTFVLLSHSHLFFAKKAANFVEVVKRNDLALQWALKSKTTVPNAIPDFNDDGIAINMDSAPWGLYNTYMVTSTFQKNSFKKISLVGSGLDPTTSPSLYLKDNKRPLIVVGATKIIGKAYIPQQGVRPGNIGGEAYFGNRLVYGPTSNSKTGLPQLDQSTTQQITTLSHQNLPNTGETIKLSKNHPIKNSFFDPPQVISGDYIDLANTILTGHIVVMATKEIRIHATSILTDVLLCAPKITVGDNTIGTFQAFASKEIKVGKNCTLKYPSALVVAQKNAVVSPVQSRERPIAIHINAGSVIKGDVVYLQRTEERVFSPQIKLEPNASIMGQVYCQKSMELKGDVWGSVYTDSFISMENGNIYQNHLYNGIIDRTQLFDGYGGIDINKTPTPKKVMKWLY